MDWIRKRAAEARKQEKHTKWLANKGRLIESHSGKYFEELSRLMEKSVAAFNAEFPEPVRQIEKFERSLHRFVAERKSVPTVRLECRLDYAGNFVRYQYIRTHTWRNKTYRYDGCLEFDVSGKHEVLLHSADLVPMKVEQVTQFLLEPFFEF